MQRYFAEKREDNTFILNKNDEYHIKKVMRMQKNDMIEVVFNHHVFLSQIMDLESMQITIIRELEVKDDRYPYIALIIPALKEQKMDFILQKGTELGVNAFIVIPFERSMVKYDNKEENKLGRWQKICKEASEQSKRVDIPKISIEKDWTSLSKINGLKLVCSTTEHDCYIKNVLKNNSQTTRINFVIGPEGGISPKEEQTLETMGFSKISLGSQIMRVETVPLFVTSVIRYEYTE